MRFVMTRIIETRRLHVRQLTIDDLPEYLALLRDPLLRQALPEIPDNRAGIRAELTETLRHYASHGFGIWAMVDRTTGALIGRCGLTPERVDDRDEIAVTVALAPALWGRGLASEAGQAVVAFGFEHLHLPRLVGLVPPDNPAAVRLAEKLGLAFEKEVPHRDRVRRLYATYSP